MELTTTIIVILRALVILWCVAVVAFIALVIAEWVDYIKEKKEKKGSEKGDE